VQQNHSLFHRQIQNCISLMVRPSMPFTIVTIIAIAAIVTIAH
jgi:hypothetical protein